MQQTYKTSKNDWVKIKPNCRLTSQCGYPVIIHNLISTPIWSCRVFFGPLHLALVDVVISTSNACITWVLLCLTEALMVRAVMITKFRYVSGIDDNFMGTFIFMVNKGFSFGSHIALSILGLYILLINP